MIKRYFDTYLKFFHEKGHEFANSMIGIDANQFGVISEHDSDQEIIDLIGSTQIGVYLAYSDQEFLNKALEIISPYVVESYTLYSDILQLHIPINVLSIENQDYKLLMVMEFRKLINFL